MTTWQKAIKTAATVFAILLTVSIIGGILCAVGLLDSVFGSGDTVGEMKSYTVSADIVGIRLDILAADVTIQNGDTPTLESNIKELIVKEDNGILTVTENSRRGWRVRDNTAVLTLTLPADYALDSADITTGFGRLTVGSLNADSVTLELGAGEVTIDRLNASSCAQIKGGAGAVDIRGGAMHDLDADMGVGELTMAAELCGHNEIDCGVGEMTLVLTDAMTNYRIELDKGIGRATVNGDELQDGETFGTGENVVSIEGGVGEINVRFK